MNKINLIVGFVVVSLLGVLSHFVYNFFELPILKIFFPYNESIFEHLKLIIFPSLLYMVIDFIISKEKRNIFSSYVGGIITACIFTITSYYTYSGIIGSNIDIVNIIIYFVSIMILFYYRYKKITLFDGTNSVIALIILLIIVEVFTFYPPEINLFQPLG